MAKTIDLLGDLINSMSDEEYLQQEEALGISIHKIPYKECLVPIESIDARPDWQPRSETDENRWLMSIIAEGLTTRLLISYHSDDNSNNAMTGRHRIASLLKIKETRPETWKRHGFDAGIPCKVYTDLTIKEELALRTDEGRIQEPLSGKVECFRALLPHYETGVTEHEIQQRFWRMIADTCCTSKTRAELYQAFKDCVDPKAFFAKVNGSIRNHSQLLGYVYNVPKTIREHWMNAELGIKNADGSIPKSLTNAQMRKLSGAHTTDKKADAENGSKDNIGYENMGVGCKHEYEEILKVKKEKASEIVYTPMVKADRDKHILDGKSQVEKIIFSAIGGNPNALAQLQSKLDWVSRFETAGLIDFDTMEMVCIEVTKRQSALPEKTRLEIIQKMRKAPVGKVPEAKVPEGKVPDKTGKGRRVPAKQK